jgi:hypothetical protein
METSPEFVALQNEVAALRGELAELQKYLIIQKKEGLPDYVKLRCSMVTVFDGSDASLTRANLGTSEDGPYLSFYGKDQKARMFLSSQKDDTRCDLYNKESKISASLAADEGPHLCLYGSDEKSRVFITAEKDDAQCDIYDKAGKVAVSLAVTPEGGGQVSVHHEKNPRAVLKALPTSGVVSVVNDKGFPYAAMVGEEAGGQLVILTSEGEPVVKLMSDTPHGGMVAVANKQGEPLVALTVNEAGGAMFTSRTDGGVACSIMTNEDGGSILTYGKDQKMAAAILNTAGGCGLRLHNSAGNVMLEMMTEVGGGSLHLRDTKGVDRIALMQGAMGPLLTLKSEEKENLVMLSAFNGEGAVMLHNKAGACANFQMSEKSTGLSLIDAKKNLQIYFGHDVGTDRASFHLKPKENENSAVALATGPEGGIIMVSGPDGTRRGGICAARDGGQLLLFNDLGIERVLLGSADDGGLLKLNWGGNVGMSALATHKGGVVIVNNADGKVSASLPLPDEEGADD